jgi:hypothetical protein
MFVRKFYDTYHDGAANSNWKPSIEEVEDINFELQEQNESLLFENAKLFLMFVLTAIACAVSIVVAVFAYI